MQTDIGTYIADLLFEHDNVSIPGLGSFSKNYKGAAIEYVQGQVVPPTSTIIFNPNLPIDDGLLVNYVKKKRNVPLTVAEDMLTNYVIQVKAKIEKKEFIVFEGLGRLFKDFEGKLKFLSESNNFNTDAFGLPKLNYYPIARAENAPSDSQTAISPIAETVSNGIADWFTRNLIWLTIATFLLILLVIYFLVIKSQPITKQAIFEPPIAQVNISPIDNDSDFATIEDEDEMEGETTPENEETFTDEIDDSEDAHLPPSQKSAIIIIGKFGKTSNVQKLVKDIYELGYEPYTDKEGKLTVVGIQMLYDDEDEVLNTLEKVRSKFAPDARILRMK